MNNIDNQYQVLLQDILDNGVSKQDRTGTGTKSVFGRQIRYKMSEGFPLLTTKKMHFKSIVTELLWFLRGGTNIKYLVDNNCHIWDGDAYKRYYHHKDTFGPLTMEQFVGEIKTNNEFANKWGELGPIYGKQWRAWDFPEVNGYFGPIDQIKILIQSLKTNPDSRRLMVNAWNVGKLHEMVLPPCHYGFQVYTRELTAKERTALGSNGSTRLYDMIKEANYETIDADKEMHAVCDMKNIPTRAISLMWNQRSVDTFLGLPFNIASYGLLLEIIAKEVNMVPDELIGNLGDTHLYLNHIEQAKEQINRTPYELPEVRLRNYDTLDELLNTTNSMDMIQLWRYDSHPTIKAPLSN
jgi:thymidylate synthase